MDRWKRGKKFAYQMLFAGLTCLSVAATGFLLTARSQTIEIYRGSEIEEMTFEDGVPVSEFRSRARTITADAVSAAENGDYELALRLAKAALQYEAADWGPDEVTPSQLIKYIESGQHLEDEQLNDAPSEQYDEEEQQNYTEQPVAGQSQQPQSQQPMWDERPHDEPLPSPTTPNGAADSYVADNNNLQAERDWEQFASDADSTTPQDLDQYRPPAYPATSRDSSKFAIPAATPRIAPAVAATDMSPTERGASVRTLPEQTFPERTPSERTLPDTSYRVDEAVAPWDEFASTEPTSDVVINRADRPVKLNDTAFQWQRGNASAPAAAASRDRIQPASGLVVASRPRRVGYATVAATDSLPFDPGLQRINAGTTNSRTVPRPNSFPPVGDTSSTGTARGQRASLESLPQGFHLNVSSAPPQTATVAAASETNGSLYVILAVLSLIFVFGSSLVFLATFVLLKDRQQKQDGVIRIELGSLNGLEALARLTQAAGGPQPEVATLPAADATAAAAAVAADDSPPTLQIAGRPSTPEADEDAMFQHLLEDNIELHRNLNQLPKAA